jgi:hypothetical protein
MSQSIIETALTNRTLHLELTYRTPSKPLEDEDDTAEFEPQTRAALRPTLQPISGEFACLLSVL